MWSVLWLSSPLLHCWIYEDLPVHTVFKQVLTFHLLICLVHSYSGICLWSAVRITKSCLFRRFLTAVHSCLGGSGTEKAGPDEHTQVYSKQNSEDSQAWSATTTHCVMDWVSHLPQGLIVGGWKADWVASQPPWVCSVRNIFCLSTLWFTWTNHSCKQSVQWDANQSIRQGSSWWW